jgi:sugar phosphate permease
MSRTIIAACIAVTLSLLCATGCAKKSPPQEPTKTAAEYKAEADKQIQQENADAELSKLQQSVDAEAAQQ